MRRAIWATLSHCMSTDDQPRHTRCPEGMNSWCFYQKANAAGTEPGPHATNIHHSVAYDIAKDMVDTYTRMSQPSLLQRLSKGKTQNPNESFHSVVWSRCSKRVFVGLHKLEGAVASAVGSFNAGQKALGLSMELLGIEVNEITHAYLEEVDQTKEAKAAAATTATTQQKRLAKQQLDKAERAASLAGGPYLRCWIGGHFIIHFARIATNAGSNCTFVLILITRAGLFGGCKLIPYIC
jgi:hypothetical protein